MLIAGLAAATAFTGVMSTTVAAAQPYDHRDWRGDHDRGYHDRGDRGDHDRGGQWRYYGGRYGYSGYRGPWRAGQRYPHWRDHRYVVEDWRAYHLPPPRPGYRYYRDDNGDIVMAAVASGMIGLILGGALSH